MPQTSPEKQYKVGVLFVHGIGEQAKGDTLVQCSEALQNWLNRWIKGAGIEGAVAGKPRVAPNDIISKREIDIEREIEEALPIKREIEDALRRHADIDPSRITVEAEHGLVTLKGIVQSWAERQEAERVAWGCRASLGWKT
jgi:hypothetical protein